MQMVCLIWRSDDTELLVVPEMLNFIENPSIASIPQINEEYYKECHYLNPSDLEQIVHPQALSPFQEEMMSHHCHLLTHHFQSSLLWQSKAKFQSILHNCAIVAHFACRACLELHTNIRGKPNPKKVIPFKRNPTCLMVPKL
jgi:hypothetical protein